MSDKQEDAVLSWIEEALELRHGVAGDPKGALKDTSMLLTAMDAMEFLERVRVRQDRVSELLAKATQARARARRAEAQAKFSADEAYDKAMQSAGNTRREFTSGREIAADAALDSLEQRRVAHQASRLVSVTQEAYDVIYQCHSQLEALRTDIRSYVRSLQWESGLEH